MERSYYPPSSLDLRFEHQYVFSVVLDFTLLNNSVETKYGALESGGELGRSRFVYSYRRSSLTSLVNLLRYFVVVKLPRN